MAAMDWETQEQIDAREEAEMMASLFTWKTDIWSRCTEAEAEQLDGALQEANVKQRRMWDDCLTIEHKSDLFALLKEQLTVAFGEARAIELLQPSNEV